MKSSGSLKEKTAKPAVRGRPPTKSPTAKKSTPQVEAFPELMVVGINISKNKSYYLAQKKLIKRVAHGIYIPLDKLDDTLNILTRHAVRLACTHFKNAAGLCYSSAFLMDAVKINGDAPVVYMSGDYSYRLELGEEGSRVILVQSLHKPQEMVEINGEYEFYIDKIYADPIGEFVVRVPVPELLVLQNFERIKEWMSKRIEIDELKKFVQWIVDTRYNGSVPAFSAGLAEMAMKCNRLEEHDHAVAALIEGQFAMSKRYLRQTS